MPNCVVFVSAPVDSAHAVRFSRVATCSGPVHQRLGDPCWSWLPTVVQPLMSGVLPSLATHSWLSSCQAYVSMTAKTLSSFVHCRHLAFMSESLVGSYDTISGSILRQLMPPRALTSSTNVWID